MKRTTPKDIDAVMQIVTLYGHAIHEGRMRDAEAFEIAIREALSDLPSTKSPPQARCITEFAERIPGGLEEAERLARDVLGKPAPDAAPE